MRKGDLSSTLRTAPVPLTLVTGFLGSGKSTFINSAVHSNPQTRFGVLVNEFGDIGIENDIIQTHEDDVVELSGGCMCCRLRDDLVGALRTLFAHTESIDHILVEASGLSDPLPIANTFHSHNLESRVRFDAMVCMIDALNFDSTYRDYTLAVRQLNYASFLVITKAEQCRSDEIRSLRQRLAEMAPNARIGVLGRDISAAEVIAAGSQIDAVEAAVEAGSGHTAAHPQATGDRSKENNVHPDLPVILCTTDTPTTRDAVDAALAELGQTVVRAKGRIYVDTPEGDYVYYIVQGVAGRREFYPCPRKPGSPPRSSLLLIGSPDRELSLPSPLSEWEAKKLPWE